MSTAWVRREAFRGESLPEIAIRAPVTDAYADILTAGALELLTHLHHAVDDARRELLGTRALIQRGLDQGALPAFPLETGSPRTGGWTAAPAPADLVDRRVAVASPVEARSLIAALNSGADACVADFDTCTSPTWSNLIEGQQHLRDAVAGSLGYTSAGGLLYRMQRDAARLSLRPRGWPLDERRVIVDDRPVSAALFDLCLFLFHNAAPLRQRDATPHLELGRMQFRHEARWWNDVLALLEDQLGLPRGTVRVTVVVDHVLTTFELDEILWELRDHATALAWSKWDYLHSFVRTFHHRPELVLPERHQLTRARHFLRAAAELVVQSAHRREIHALTGVVTELPIREHSAAHRRVMRLLRADLSRDAEAGFDGVCLGHTELVPAAREVFGLRIAGPHQIARKRDDAEVTPEDLLAVPACVITDQGLRETVAVALEYLEAWLRGIGRVAVDHHLEDTASAELAAAQLWQWHKHGARLDDGRLITFALLEGMIADELARRSEQHGSAGFESSRFLNAADLLTEMVREHELPDGLCVAARPYLR